jgi:hypothetical protein
MRQLVGGIAAFAFAALFVQSPWAHVHTGAHDSDHHQQQHRQLVLAHDHDLKAGRGPAVHGPEGQTDTRSLGSVIAVCLSAMTIHAIVGRTETLPEATLFAVDWHADFTPRAHGPPLLGTLQPRAPPA